MPAFSSAQQEEDIFAAPPAGRGKQALFTIFYNAESTGEVHPCPT